MALMIAPSVQWGQLLGQLRSAVPEAFGNDGNPLNLIEGQWSNPGHGKRYATAVDGSELGRIPMIDLDTAKRAVKFAANEHQSWSQVDLDERRRRVSDCLDLLCAHRELISRLLRWEIGKPLKLAQDDVDRCISGV